MTLSFWKDYYIIKDNESDLNLSFAEGFFQILHQIGGYLATIYN